MDIWVDRTPENYKKIRAAFLKFGMPVFGMTEENFLHHQNWDVFTFGLPPSAIDVMVKVKGLEFDTVYQNSTTFTEDGLLIRTIHIEDLKAVQKASARPKDLDDLENLS
jgi:hypothetical protein